MSDEEVQSLHDSDGELGEYDTHPLIVTIQAFLEYANHMMIYGLIVQDFFGLNEDMWQAVDEMLEAAVEMQKNCRYSLYEETLEDLLEREAAILEQIDSDSYQLALCETNMDRYLILSDTGPEIYSQFLSKEGLPLFDSAICRQPHPAP